MSLLHCERGGREVLFPPQAYEEGLYGGGMSQWKTCSLRIVGWGLTNVSESKSHLWVEVWCIPGTSRDQENIWWTILDLIVKTVKIQGLLLSWDRFSLCFQTWVAQIFPRDSVSQNWGSERRWRFNSWYYGSHKQSSTSGNFRGEGFSKNSPQHLGEG